MLPDWRPPQPVDRDPVIPLKDTPDKHIEGGMPSGWRFPRPAVQDPVALSCLRGLQNKPWWRVKPVALTG